MVQVVTGIIYLFLYLLAHAFLSKLLTPLWSFGHTAVTPRPRSLQFLAMAIATTLGNGLVLMALRKVSSDHAPTKLLFQCLAVTDL